MAIAALASAASTGALAATPPDPAIYDAGVPAGMIEHGRVAFTISGSPNAQRDVIEYWVSHDGWRSTTREAATGSLLSEGFGDAHSTHRYQPLNPASTRLIDTALPSPPPLAGFTAAYNKELLQRGLLTAIGPVTIAGFSGTAYVVPDDRKTSSSSKPGWRDDGTSAKTEITLENGTDAPLVRQTSVPRPGHTPFVQREELTSRETVVATPDQLATFSKAASERRLDQWKAQSRAATKRHSPQRKRHARRHHSS
jgi:hypothetical protein